MVSFWHLETYIKSEVLKMGNLKPEDDLMDYTSTWVAPVVRIIESGLFWKVYTQDNNLIFSVFGHKILTIDSVGDVVADNYKKAGKP